MKFQWDGEVMRPLLPKFADRYFVIGEEYRLREGRSEKSEGHFFGVIHWAWVNLPEEHTAAFPNAEDLRKRALIATGWANSRQLVLGTNAQAIAAAAFLGACEGYRVVSVHENIVTELTPRSQDRESMGADDFQKSKDDAIEYCAVMVGVSVEELVKASHSDFARRNGKKKP